MWGRPKIFPFERESDVVIVKPTGDSLAVQERQLKKGDRRHPRGH